MGIDGKSEMVAVGGFKGEGVEIWSVDERKMVHHIECPFDNSFVSCPYSANGILAVGMLQNRGGKRLYLYDESSWTKIYHKEFNMSPRFLFLTADCKYLAAGGTDVG